MFFFSSIVPLNDIQEARPPSQQTAGEHYKDEQSSKSVICMESYHQAGSVTLEWT